MNVEVNVTLYKRHMRAGCILLHIVLHIGFGASLLALSANVIIVNKEFTGRRTVAYGIASSGAAAGTTVLPYFTSWCIDVYGWRGCFILMGGLCLQCVIVGAALYSGQRVAKADIEKQTGNKLFFSFLRVFTIRSRVISFRIYLPSL